MAEAPYLVALALLERGGQRALPLTGQSQPAGTPQDAAPGSLGQTLVLELLLRLWEQSAERPLRRLEGEASLLLLELPLEPMTAQLPPLKAEWLRSGDNEALLRGLRQLARRGWRVEQSRQEPIRFQPWI